MDETKVLLNKIIERLDVQSATLEQLKMDVAHIQGDVTELKETLQKHDDLLARLIEGQERQDKILESLALRSLEQETELRELKRIK
ncbi:MULTISPECIES: hypothetical protein [Aneurinibacillus]|uniref:Uncharacterized protein n=1 Tax=Aneurinibacillus thermoaerophilus TaxID=143495 RepID=A0A1G7XDJ7_ANETH|nr:MULTISPECIES: hypothetical protein [Aneurinibacillus]AMA73300.1 hypothetical protein ACH33_10840 [Aneurinibacillus sp. XH2]MED0677185.1 hypothetical protein [Aneurinibacillus thermoaerophilus]MED0678276.1 hypothetical protein [Aneurinibacillus thermoaerophilus]MED0736198.1 hypothetical protein [Aneurinibacillus thermoaerophilus]MED0758827.1 hypothetical protein [Aneurinibacillus thermoaerophilus]